MTVEHAFIRHLLIFWRSQCPMSLEPTDTIDESVPSGTRSEDTNQDSHYEHANRVPERSHGEANLAVVDAHDADTGGNSAKINNALGPASSGLDMSPQGPMDASNMERNRPGKRKRGDDDEPSIPSSELGKPDITRNSLPCPSTFGNHNPADMKKTCSDRHPNISSVRLVYYPLTSLTSLTAF